MYVYGGLSEKPAQVHPIDLIYKKKQLKGFLLTDWMGSSASLQTLRRMNQASASVLPNLKGGWSESQFVDVKPEDMMKTFLAMRKGEGFTNKKLRIRWAQA